MRLAAQPRLTALASLIALAAIATPALAAEPFATASITVSGLRFRLIDLDPTDGIAPTATFLGDGALTTTHNAGIWDPTESEIATPLSGVGLPLPTVSQGDAANHISLTANGITAVATAGPGASPSFLGLDGDSVNGYRYAYHLGDGHINKFGIGDTETNAPFTIELGANTGIVFEGTVNTNVQFNPSVAQIFEDTVGPDHPYTTPGSDGSGTFYGIAALSIDLEGKSADTNTSIAHTTSYQHVNELWNDPYHLVDPLQASTSDTFLVDYWNLGSTSTVVNFNLLAGAMAGVELNQTFNTSGTPAIPEPGTWALMGLGLAGVALARRRHRA